MKRITIAVWIGLLVALAVVSGCSSKEQLRIYSWADNFDEDVLKDFEQQFNVKVRYDTFSNNEELLAKMQAGGAKYDLIQPSDYMVATMIQLGLLEELNKDNIPNSKNIAASYLNLPFDPGNKYSLIYTSGVTGIAYNKKYVKDPITSWADLWKAQYKGKVVLLDDQKEIIGMGLKKNGYSNSTKDEKQLQTAVADLKNLLPSVLAFDTDNIKQKFIAEEAWIGTLWSGDAARIVIDEKKIDLGYVIPKEGALIFADNYAIPKGTKHKELAEKFINYMLQPEISAKNFESVGYSDPNEKAQPFHSKEYLSIPMLNLTADQLKQTEWIKDTGEMSKVYDRLWTELKAGKK
jgi:spermidine/putrescine transport system substrate-binding protein